VFLPILWFDVFARVTGCCKLSCCRAHHKGQYTLATKSNSTWLTLLQVDHVALAPYTLVTKSNSTWLTLLKGDQVALAPYTLVTKSNSTWLTLLQVDHVTLYTLVTKSKGHSTFDRQKLPIFEKVDRVEHVQLWQQCRWRQNGNKSVRKSTVDSVCRSLEHL